MNYISKLFFIITLGLSNFVYASDEVNCMNRAANAVKAIEAVYGDISNYKFKSKLIHSIGKDITNGDHEVTGGVLYKVKVIYGNKTIGNYFVTLTNNFPDYPCVISQVQYLGNNAVNIKK